MGARAGRLVKFDFEACGLIFDDLLSVFGMFLPCFGVLIEMIIGW